MLNFFVPDIICDSVYDIDFDLLKKEKNIKGLIFDIDNTLVSYKQENPTENVVNLMNKLKKLNFKVCFVSNNNKKRVDLFNSEFNYFSFPDAQKPRKKGMDKALESMKLTSGNIAVIGDQLFTDIAAAKRIRAMSILVNPIEPVENLFFKLKRFFERPFIEKYYRKLNEESEESDRDGEI